MIFLAMLFLILAAGLVSSVAEAAHQYIEARREAWFAKQFPPARVVRVVDELPF